MAKPTKAALAAELTGALTAKPVVEALYPEASLRGDGGSSRGG